MSAAPSFNQDHNKIGATRGCCAFVDTHCFTAVLRPNHHPTLCALPGRVLHLPRFMHRIKQDFLIPFHTTLLGRSACSSFEATRGGYMTGVPRMLMHVTHNFALLFAATSLEGKARILTLLLELLEVPKAGRCNLRQSTSRLTTTAFFNYITWVPH